MVDYAKERRPSTTKASGYTEFGREIIDAQRIGVYVGPTPDPVPFVRPHPCLIAPHPDCVQPQACCAKRPGGRCLGCANRSADKRKAASRSAKRRHKDPQYRAQLAAGRARYWDNAANRKKKGAQIRDYWAQLPAAERVAIQHKLSVAAKAVCAKKRQSGKRPHKRGPRPGWTRQFERLSEYGRTEYKAAKAEGFSHADALEIARDAEAQQAKEAQHDC